MPVPIQNHLDEIVAALDKSGRAVVEAPPGAGKTTRVPLAMCQASFLDRKKIIMLEPRRLAARSSAVHMADLLGEKPGQTVGYQVRLDRMIGPDTRIEVVTEGIFTRRIQNDPSLADIGLVIFDEFHERSIHSDLGLALCLEAREVLRPDLRVLVMSATMDVEAVSRLLGHAPVISSKGKSFPVKTIYVPPAKRQGRIIPIEAACESVVRQALTETSGDILVFMPGVPEIQRLAQRLKESPGTGIRVIPLHGRLTREEQTRAFAPPDPAARKIIIATSIAETSLTIEGIRVVVDSGLMRVPMFSLRTGMTQLKTLPVSKASADQRRGRAGRTASGTCYRLWSEYDQGLLTAFTRPEILSVDLSWLALELFAWGAKDPGELKWLDPPEATSFDQARSLLRILGALDKKGMITAHGKKMGRTGLHPRLAHMVVQGSESGLGSLACRLAAFLEDQDFVRFDPGEFDPDIRLRLEIMDAVQSKRPFPSKGMQINLKKVRRILAVETKLTKSLGIRPANRDPGSCDPDQYNPDQAGPLLALAYPDRIARKRDNRTATFLMASGKGAFFQGPNSLSLHEYIVAVHLDGNPKNAKIYLAAPYSREDLETCFSDSFNPVRSVAWDKNTESVTAVEEIFFGSIVVEKQPLDSVDPEETGRVMIREIEKRGLLVLPWTQTLSSLKERAVFLRHTGRFPNLPDLSDAWLMANLDSWLGPFFNGIISLKQLERIDLRSALSMLLTWEAKQVVEKNAPTHITVPSGSRHKLKYSGDKGPFEAPVLAVRLQEMFGLCATPKIAGNTLPVTLHLLSPAGRPVQITQDLKSFWVNTYPEVKKDLMGRYPRHYWPDDPLAALPTNRVRPQTP